jgi:large conductance mechanosensitive channel
MGMLKEFRDFAMRGNVIDMAVGVVIGAAFSKIVTSLVDNIMMPPIGYATGGIDFKDKVAVLIPKSETLPGVTIQWGLFVNAIIQFAIVALCLFLVIKLMNEARKRFEEKKLEKPADAPADIKLLTEIRDLLAKQQTKVPG